MDTARLLNQVPFRLASSFSLPEGRGGPFPHFFFPGRSLDRIPPRTRRNPPHLIRPCAKNFRLFSLPLSQRPVFFASLNLPTSIAHHPLIFFSPNSWERSAPPCRFNPPCRLASGYWPRTLFPPEACLDIFWGAIHLPLLLPQFFQTIERPPALQPCCVALGVVVTALRTNPP